MIFEQLFDLPDLVVIFPVEFDKTEDGTIFLESSSSDLKYFRIWHPLPVGYPHARLASRDELRDYTMNFARYEFLSEITHVLGGIPLKKEESALLIPTLFIFKCPAVSYGRDMGRMAQSRDSRGRADLFHRDDRSERVDAPYSQHQFPHAGYLTARRGEAMA